MYNYNENDNVENDNTVLEQINENKCAECKQQSTSTNTLCELCTKKENIDLNRRNAKLKLENQVKRMKALLDSRFPPCSVGYTVRGKIPDVIGEEKISGTF